MATDTDREFERLVDDLLSGKTVSHSPDKRFSLADIFDATTWIDCDEFVARLISGDSETRADLISKAEKQARAFVENWVRTNPFGIDLWRQRIADAREEATA
jgi:hypothetical protein